MIALFSYTSDTVASSCLPHVGEQLIVPDSNCSSLAFLQHIKDKYVDECFGLKPLFFTLKCSIPQLPSPDERCPSFAKGNNVLLLKHLEEFAVTSQRSIFEARSNLVSILLELFCRFCQQSWQTRRYSFSAAVWVELSLPASCVGTWAIASIASL
jgi:hypothetical protein